MAAGRLATTVATRFNELWEHAEPQKQGTYWKLPNLEERVIDFRRPVEEIVLHIRAYGASGSLANIGNHWFVVRRAVGWSETHSNPLGCIMHIFNKSFVVAVSDGYLGIIESAPMVTQQRNAGCREFVSEGDEGLGERGHSDVMHHGDADAHEPTADRLPVHAVVLNHKQSREKAGGWQSAAHISATKGVA
jgi:hypothetical protein